MSDWIQITAPMPPGVLEASALIEAFIESGCPSVLEEGDPPVLVGYLANTESSHAVVRTIGERLATLGVPHISTSEVDDKDWDSVWREHFKPRRVGSRFVIVPSWEAFEARSDDLVINLDPGQAFGTGDHPTTRLCLALMEKAQIQGCRVADVGCGTGVLAIGAYLLGAQSVLASDLDPLAVDIANQNFERNGCPLRAVTAAGFDAVDIPVDLAVSNIISATLIRIGADAFAAIKEGGAWIVSGVIKANWNDVRRSTESVGFRCEELCEEDDWIAAQFRR